MHLTGQELTLAPTAVAAIAVVGGYIGVRSANLNARLMAREQYVLDHKTDMYISMLKGAHYRGVQLTEAFAQSPCQAAPSVPRVADITSDEEATFGAQVLAYCTQEACDAWCQLTEQTSSFLSLLSARRQSSGIPLGQIPGIEHEDEIAEANVQWQLTKELLVRLVRAELDRPGRLDRRGGALMTAQPISK